MYFFYLGVWFCGMWISIIGRQDSLCMSASHGMHPVATTHLEGSESPAGSSHQTSPWQHTHCQPVLRLHHQEHMLRLRLAGVTYEIPFWIWFSSTGERSFCSWSWTSSCFQQ